MALAATWDSGKAMHIPCVRHGVVPRSGSVDRMS
jgi:hypothetical protein